LPVVREILAFAVGGRHDQWQAFVGEPLAAALPSDTAGNDLELVRPDDRKVSLSVSATSRDRSWRYDDTDVAGIYTVQRGGADVARFAVNVNTRESELARVDPAKLPPEITVRGDWRSAEKAVASGVVPERFWNRSLLWAAAVLALMELCLAWLFGRGAA
jgi:hypothetical protein